MSSLEELKKKMAMMFSESSDNVTIPEVKDKTWKARIGCAGNRPEDWLEYISQLKLDPNTKPGTVFSAYCEAIEAIDDRKHMENIHMVRLFLQYMEWKVKKCPDEVEAMLKYARSTFRNFVIVHIEGAEFELRQGEMKKAERILEKSKQIKPRPYNMLLVAMRNMAEGQVQLLTQDQKEECLSVQLLEQDGGTCSEDSSDEIQFGVIKQPSVRFGDKDDVSDTMPLSVFSSRTVAGESKIQHYHSTPDCSKMTSGQSVLSSSSKWKRPIDKHIFGPPMRVKRNAFPSSETEEERILDYYEPLDTSNSKANECMLRGSSTSSQDSSGEVQFVSRVSKLASARFYIDEERKEDVSGTMPLSVFSSRTVAGESKLQHYHSTPDCSKMTSGQSVLSSSSKWKRPSSKHVFGMPLRVKRSTLPSAIETDERFMDNFQPLDTSAREHDVFDTHMHSSGYLSMNQPDTSIAMETNSCNPTPFSHRQISHVDSVVETGNKNIEDQSNQSLNCGVKPQTCHQKVKNSSSQKVKDNPHRICLTDQVQATTAVSSTTSVEEKISIPTVKNVSAPSCTSVTPSLANMEMITVNDQHYTKLNLIGKGGSAEVFHVFDSNRNSRAVKCVDLSNANNMMKEGYMNEIRLLQRLQYCESVIKMYDYEYKESENKLYVVMERAEIDLATFFQRKMKNKKCLDDKLVKFYWKEMLVAVEALHKEGIIHSDLKPANFILVAGNLKLIDFGIANAIQQDMTSVLLTTPMGTPNYMSPETLLDSGVDCNPKHKINTKSDMWSLGCILYNMVYGKTPFQDIRNCWSKLSAIKDPKHVIQLPPIQDENLLDVLQRCLNRDPTKRPSATELLSHAYLKEDNTRQPDDKQGTPVAASDVKRLLVQFSESSPRTIQALTKDLLEKLNSGQKIDLNKIQVKSEHSTTKPNL
ncbi:dual specificity protein kinase TTK-like [Gigantopelta aegis]|uniref:dual specificity protein kinase TTK-like n=1 Tax=Gigantopelta aegis TaxID=1735272 RepID=UPI001B88917B|nr:dual specificity protein kinase TTK-like [Gigantopelta aegis]